MTTIKTTAPGLSSQPENIKDNCLLKNYARYDVEFKSGNGINLYDTDGKEYLDFLSGIAVTGFGHNHPAIVQAVEEQISNLWHVSNLFQSGGQISLANKLAQKSGLDKVFFCNSGTEANEAAIKFARKWGKGRSHIITAINSFHGRTLGSLAATGQYKIWEGFGPLAPGFVYVPYGDIEALQWNYSPHVVAVMLEPIQGESGIIVPPDGYLEQVKEFCQKNNLLLIFDEVQSGMGRTGKFFAHQWENAKPDIITCAKGLANGLPLGAVICSDEVAEGMTPGSHGSTFGGNPVAVAAANKVLDLLDDDCLAAVASAGEYLKKSVRSIVSSKISTVRGKGLLVGIELSEGTSAKAVAKNLLGLGIVTGTSGDNVLRILPPFLVTEKDIDLFADRLQAVLNIE